MYLAPSFYQISLMDYTVKVTPNTPACNYTELSSPI